jgi:hypothetical protein
MNKFSQFVNENDYNLFVKTADLYIENPFLYQQQLNEGILDFFKDKIQFIKDLAEKFSIDVVNLLKIFKEKYVFGFFSKIGWSMAKLVELVQKGHKIQKNLHDIIFKWAKEHGVTKWTDDKIKLLDEYLNHHPYLKTVTGLAVAGFLIYQWTNLISFTGEVDFDFDQTSLFQALTGSFSLTDIFGGENGLKLLTFITTGTLFNISLPYPGGTWVLFVFSIIYTVSKYKFPQIANSMKPMLKKVSVLKKEKI